MSKLQKIAEWFLDAGNGFLDDLLFEAVSISRRLSHYDHDDRVVSGLDAKFYVDFTSPVAEETEDIILEKVILEFNIERHGPIKLKYETYEFTLEGKETMEEATLLAWMDCCHMEGPSYDDIDPIRWILTDRLMTLADGEEITNLGILNCSQEDQIKIIGDIRKRWFNRTSCQKAIGK